MKKILMILLLALLILAVSACDGMFDDDYLYVSVHDEQYTVDEGSDALTAENFLGLKNAILSFVENHVEYGVIRIYNYDGDVESDLADAAYEVAKTDPLGAYAVDYMTHDCTLIVSYYEIHIYITFARTLEEIQSVERVNSIAALKDRFSQALLDGQQSVTLRVSSYDEQDYTALVRNCYAGNASRFTELPQVAVELFPSSGVQRILRFTFQYEKDAQTRVEEQALLKQTIAELTQKLPASGEPLDRFAALSTSLLEKMAEQEVSEDAILFDTLCGESFNSESVAYALGLLAEEAGLTCVPVHGRRNNATYSWNIITVDDHSYHVDLLRDLMQENQSMNLYADAEMESEYTWDREAYPACEAIPVAAGPAPEREPLQPAELETPPEGEPADPEPGSESEPAPEPEQPVGGEQEEIPAEGERAEPQPVPEE